VPGVVEPPFLVEEASSEETFFTIVVDWVTFEFVDPVVDWVTFEFVDPDFAPLVAAAAFWLDAVLLKGIVTLMVFLLVDLPVLSTETVTLICFFAGGVWFAPNFAVDLLSAEAALLLAFVLLVDDVTLLMIVTLIFLFADAAAVLLPFLFADAAAVLLPTDAAVVFEDNVVLLPTDLVSVFADVTTFVSPAVPECV
jgi:hypothetical protein